MHQYNLRLGYPTKSLGMHSQASRDFDEMVDVADARCAAAVDAIIDGLTPRYRAALYHCHLGTSWRYMMGWDTCYLLACEQIRNSLRARGIE